MRQTVLSVPKLTSFSKKGLYFVFIGGNDIHYALGAGLPVATITDLILPELVSNISSSVAVRSLPVIPFLHNLARVVSLHPSACTNSDEKKADLHGSMVTVSLLTSDQCSQLKLWSMFFVSSSHRDCTQAPGQGSSWWETSRQ